MLMKMQLIVNYLTAEYHSCFEQRKDEFYKVLTLQKKTYEYKIDILYNFNKYGG